MEEIKNQTNLASDQGNNKKSNAAIIGIAIILILILLGVVFWFIFQFLMPNIKQKPSPQTSDNQTFCQQDSDCVLIPVYENCCSVCGQEVAHINDKDSIISERQKLCPFTDQLCPIYKCPLHNYKAVCEQNKCITKVTPVVSNVDLLITLDKDKYQKGERVNIDIQSYKDVDMDIYNIAVEYSSEQPGGILQAKWEVADNDIQCPCGARCEKVAQIITSKGIKKIVWDQYTNKINTELSGTVLACKKADAGRYRFKIDYLGNARAGEKQELQTIYSNDFWIAEESSALPNTNIANTNISGRSDQYKIVGSLSSSGEASFIEKIGNNVFMTDITEGLLAIDVSNPAQPKLLSKIKIDGSGSYALAASANGSYLVVSGYGNARVALVDVDMENPSIMKVVSEIDIKRSAQDIVLVGDRAYLAIDGPEIEILKVEKEIPFPFALKGIISQGTMQIQGGGHAIGIADFWNSMDNSALLVIAQGESGVGVYDLSMPATPKISFTASIGYGSAVAMEEDLVYASIGDAVKVIDISAQKEIKSIDTESIWNLKVKDNMLYVASGEEGVKIFDVSDINNPKQIATIDTPGRARDLVIDGDYIYVADDRDDLQIIWKQ